jgi:hypothetical protein
MNLKTLLIATLTCISTVSMTRAVSVGQVDTFEDGTTQNWVINLLNLGAPPAAALPVNIASGGPAGAEDNYLRLTAVGGGGAGGRLVVINFMGQWAGDYIAQGFNAIEMDVNNLGNSDLSLRLLFADPGAGPPANVAVSQVPIVVPAGSGWTSISFPIGPSHLLGLAGEVDEALRNTTELRLFHSADPTFPGPAIVAQLGVDNIRAVPETGATWALLAVGILSTRPWRRSR